MSFKFYMIIYKFGFPYTLYDLYIFNSQKKFNTVTHTPPPMFSSSSATKDGRDIPKGVDIFRRSEQNPKVSIEVNTISEVTCILLNIFLGKTRYYHAITTAATSIVLLSLLVSLSGSLKLKGKSKSVK
jgi:hypothetical protein